MPMGFVYILFNPSNPGKVKIGLTIGRPEKRAKKLYTTGVAESFHVVYDELVSDCSLVEAKMHERFAAFRKNKKREFFDIPIKTAVKALAEMAKPYLLPETALTTRCEILPKLKSKFPKCLSSDLTSVSVVQLPDLNLLELRRKPSNDQHEELVERVDLEFIAGIEESFPAGTDVRNNAAAFVKALSLATLLVISEALFSDTGLQQAIADYNNGVPADSLIEPIEVDPPDNAWRQ